MPDLMQCCVSSLLLMSCLLFCIASSQRNRTIKFEVPVDGVIRLNDGRRHYYNLSESITKNSTLKIEVLDITAQFFVSVVDTNIPVFENRNCAENVSILVQVQLLSNILCYGVSKPFTFWVPGPLQYFTMRFTSHHPKPLQLQILRFHKGANGGGCQNKSDFRCGDRCFSKDVNVRCDGLRECLDGSDEKNCGQTYSASPPFVTRYRQRGQLRSCDLPGSPSADNRFDKAVIYVVGYSSGIIISTLFFSLVIGFCFMPPYLDNEEVEEEELRQLAANRGHLDPVLDHPPSYEDVMHMDLTASPHQHAVPKQQIPESP